MAFFVDIQRTAGVRTQIVDGIRDAICTGQLATGAKLPATPELARVWGTQIATVHAAMSRLVKEGFLTRCPRKGTFVRTGSPRLTRAAIYCTENVWIKSSSTFYRVLHAALKQQLEQAGIEAGLWIDPRPESKQGVAWPELARAAAKREIQALIAISTDLPHMAWQTKLPVPAVFLTSGKRANTVDLDLLQFGELSLESLAKQGCRSVGLICAMSPNAKPVDGQRHEHAEFFARFAAQAGRLGMQTRPAWIRAPQDPDAFWRRQVPYERYGYQEFRRLWRLPQKPEGLVAYCDVVARGVVMAAVEQRAGVPATPKLALSKNDEVDLLCPLPATFVVLSAKEVARALVSQIRRQVEGAAGKPVTVGYRLQIHRGGRTMTEGQEKSP